MYSVSNNHLNIKFFCLTDKKNSVYLCVLVSVNFSLDIFTEQLNALFIFLLGTPSKLLIELSNEWEVIYHCRHQVNKYSSGFIGTEHYSERDTSIVNCNHAWQHSILIFM